VGVVTVIRRRLEDRIEVQRRDTQVLQIIKTLPHTDEVPTFITERRRITVPGFEVVRLVQSLALRKPVREDLVEHGVFDPIRGEDVSR
jgi:hypothetical protein